MIGVEHYLSLSFALFAIGAAGCAANRSNAIVILAGLVIMALAAMINFVVFAGLHGEGTGLVFALMAGFAVAGQALLVLAIAVNFYRRRGALDLGDETLLKG